MKHRKFCLIGKKASSTDKEDDNTLQHSFTKGSIVVQSKIIKGQITTKPSKGLIKDVFPSMIRDQMSEIAQNDELIVALGEVWWMKNAGNKIRRKNFTSFHMRLAGRLLLLLREASALKRHSFNQFLKPEFFDLIVQCSLKACHVNEDEELKNPSTAIKLGYDLGRLASAKLGYCIKKDIESGKNEASDFMKLIQMEWYLKVTKQARILLDERNFNKGRFLPIPDDSVKISRYLVENIQKFDLTVTDSNPEIFREVVMITEARLLLYNSRRPRELESLRWLFFSLFVCQSCFEI